MPRFILTGRRTTLNDNYGVYVASVAYLTDSGEVTHDATKAHVDTSYEEARLNQELTKRTHKDRIWTIEELPPRVPLANAILRAKPVDD